MMPSMIEELLKHPSYADSFLREKANVDYLDNFRARLLVPLGLSSYNVTLLMVEVSGMDLNGYEHSRRMTLDSDNETFIHLLESIELAYDFDKQED